MKDDSPASSREASERIRERPGRICELCGAMHGAMITLGVHVGAPTGALAQPQPAWLDHRRGSVHAREDGTPLEGGRFIVLQRPMKVALQHLPADGGAQDARLLCQWHYLSLGPGGNAQEG